MSISIADLEEVAARGWKAPDEDQLGGWLLRAAEGFTGRANSALATGDPGMPLADAVDAVSRWYRARSLPAMIAVPYPCDDPAASLIDRHLTTRDWTIHTGAATVMTAIGAALASRSAAAAWQVDVEPEPDDAWLARYHYRGQSLPPVARRLLMSAPWQAFGSVRRAGKTLAIGRVAAAGEWAGLTAVEADPEYRRRGLATAVTAALSAAAADHGAENLYLQVEDGNAPARTLYRALGFTDHHGYRYRIEPPRREASVDDRGAHSVGSD